MARKTLKTMTITDIQTELTANGVKRNELTDSIAPIQKKINNLWDRDTSLVKALTKKEVEKYKYAKCDAEFWEWVLRIHEPITGQEYTIEKNNFVDSVLVEHGVLNDFGYCGHTGQTYIRIALRRNDRVNLQKTLRGLTTIIPHLKPDEHGSKWIRVNTAEDYQSVELVVDDPGHKKYKIELGSFDVPFESDKLNDALVWIQQNAWSE